MNSEYNDPKGYAGSLKTPLGLIPPTAMEQTAWVHKLGADKYGPWNWRKTGVCASTYVNAIMRHLNAWRDGEDLDPESGYSHLAHIACSANILMDAAAVGKLQDDRIKLPANGEKKQDSLRVGEFMSVGEFKDLIESVQKDLEDFGFEITDCDLKEKVAGCDLKEEPKEYTVKMFPRQYEYLDEGDPIQQDDEYFSDVLKKWLPATLLFERVPSSLFYRRPIKPCCSKVEPQLDRCKDCGKPLTYNWLMGFLCEDCELKFNDPYETH